MPIMAAKRFRSGAQNKPKAETKADPGIADAAAVFTNDSNERADLVFGATIALCTARGTGFSTVLRGSNDVNVVKVGTPPGSALPKIRESTWVLCPAQSWKRQHKYQRRCTSLGISEEIVDDEEDLIKYLRTLSTQKLLNQGVTKASAGSGADEATFSEPNPSTLNPQT